MSFFQRSDHLFAASWRVFSFSLVILFFAGLDMRFAVAAPADDFVTTWKTDNPGITNPTSILIPMVGGPYDVDWNNDGVFDEFGLSGFVTHDFLSPGTYTVRIQGTFSSITFPDSSDKEKIISLDQWGTQSWETMARSSRR